MRQGREKDGWPTGPPRLQASHGEPFLWVHFPKNYTDGRAVYKGVFLGGNNWRGMRYSTLEVKHYTFRHADTGGSALLSHIGPSVGLL
jgi:hypothetical protein